jgi:hypothetical protein
VGAGIIYQGTHRDIVRVLSFGAVVFGLGLIWGGPDRFTSPGFAVARLMPGGCYTWGAAIALFGAVTLIGIAAGWVRRVVLSGLFLQGAWFLFWAVSLFSAFVDDARVATTGWMVYGLVSGVHFLLASTGHNLRGLPR